MKIRKIKRPKIRIRRPRVRIRWRKKNSKWVIGTVMFFFVALFAFQLVLMNYAKSILQNILSLQLEQVAGGLYTSSFDDIEISYTNKSLIISNLLLTPQKGKQEEADSENAFSGAEIYKVFIPEVHIENINLRKAFLQNFLDIGSIELKHPEISIKANFDDPTSSGTNILKKDLYKLLPERIDEFRVRTIRIIDGSLSINGRKNNEENSIEASPFQLELLNFHINEKNAHNTDKIFFTDNFFLEADTIAGYLSDKHYRFQMEALKISSADSSAFVRNLKLYPLKDPEQFIQDGDISNIYQFDLSQVYIYGISLNELYHSKDLIAGEVTVLSPALNLINLKALSPGQKESFKPEDLYPVIDKVLNSIEVKNLLLRNGQVKISEYGPAIQEKLVSKIVLANIKNFKLDSAASLNEQKLLYSDEIKFELKDYSLRLSDNLHLLQAKELYFSSEKSEIRAEGFQVIPDSINLQKRDPGTIYAANAASFSLTGVDMLKAYNSNILNIDSLWLRKPVLKLVRNRKEPPLPSPSVKAKGFHEEDLYVLIEDYLYSLNIDKISLQKGQIQIKNKKQESEDTFISNIRRANLWKVRLDSTSAYQMNKLFYANDFELEIENYDHELPDGLHRIMADEIGISTLNDKIYISDLKIFNINNQYPYQNLKTTNAKTLLNLEVPYIELDEVDILKAYLHKRLEVGSVRIPGPILELGTILGKQSQRTDLIKSSAIYSMIKDFLEVIKVKNLVLENGQLDLAFYAEKDPLLIRGRETDILVQNFRFDSLTSSNPKRLFFADNVKVKVEDFAVYLPDGIHSIKAENLYASTEQQEILAEAVIINTAQEHYTEEELIDHYGQKGYFRLKLPKVHLTGINFDQAYYQEHLKIDSVLAVKPDFSYTYLLNAAKNKRKKKANLHETNFYTAIAPFFDVLQVSSLMLKDGNFRAIQQDKDTYLESTLLEGINLELDNYLLDSVSYTDTNRFLFADDIRINIEKYQQELLDKIHTISAQNLVLSTDLQYVKAENIKLKPDSKKLRKLSNLISTSFKSRYNITLPELQINGIGFEEVFRNGVLEISELVLDEPNVHIRHHLQGADSLKRKNGNGNYDFSELIRGNLQELQILSAKVVDGKGAYTQVSNLSSPPVHFETDHFNAQIVNFKIADEPLDKEKWLYADDVSISLNGFERKLPDSLHILKVKELKLSSSKNEVELSGITLLPRPYEKILDKMRKKGADKLFYVDIPSTQLSGIDIDLFQKDSLLLDNISWKNAAVHIYSYPHFSKLQEEKNPTENTLPQQLLKGFQLIQADSLSLVNASFTFTTINERQDSSSIKLPQVNGLATNFKIDSLQTDSTGKIFFSDRVKIQVEGLNSKIDNDLYALKVKSILLDTRGGKFEADSIAITPLVDRRSFANIKGYETDQFTFRNRKLSLIDLDYSALVNEGKFMADSLLLNGFTLHIYRDKRQPYPENHFPKMPQEMVRNLETPFMLKGFAIKNGYIGYEEQAKGARGTGFIDLTDILLVGDTITNDSILIAHGLTTNIKMRSLLMGKGLLEAYFKIPLGDSLNRHSFYGSLDRMNLEEFNPILEKTVFIKIRNGQAEKIRFHVEADENIAKGNMDFQYSGLKVALVNKKTGKTGGPVKEIGSLLANWLVVNTNNLVEDSDTFKKGEMVYERDERRSTVNYWVKTLVNGFKSSIGL